MAIFSVAIVREKVRVARRMPEPLESMILVIEVFRNGSVV